jgi:YbbR domain-containing protein
VQIIRKNFGLKVISLALAIVGWAYFRYGSNPVLAARFDQQYSIPIATSNLLVGYTAHFAEREAMITVVSHRGDAAVNPADIKAQLDLADKGPGTYAVPVELIAPNVVVQSLSPATVSVTIERQ